MKNNKDSEIIEKVVNELKNKITKKDIKALYIFLDLYYHRLSEEQQLLVAEIMEKLDTDFYKDEKDENE